MTRLDLIYTYTEGFGWMVESPQLPGLVGGRETLQDTADMTPSLVQTSLGSIKDVTPVAHRQFAAEDEEGYEYLIRIADDGRFDERLDLASRMLALLKYGDFDDEDRRRQPTLATGERLLIAAQSDDTIEWCTKQLDTNEGATISFLLGPDAVASFPISDSKLKGMNSFDLRTIGVGPNSTVGETYDALIAKEVSDMAAEHREARHVSTPSELSYAPSNSTYFRSGV